MEWDDRQAGRKRKSGCRCQLNIGLHIGFDPFELFGVPFFVFADEQCELEQRKAAENRMREFQLLES